jgi:hypothetical protein
MADAVTPARSKAGFRNFKCVGARLFSESDYRQIEQDKHPKDAAALKQSVSGSGISVLRRKQSER